jgi:hypothetical protein
MQLVFENQISEYQFVCLYKVVGKALNCTGMTFFLSISWVKLVIVLKLVSLQSQCALSAVLHMEMTLSICVYCLQSTVCQKIIQALAENCADQNMHRRVEIISQDCFYRTLTDIEMAAAVRGQFDFDHPGNTCCLYCIGAANNIDSMWSQTMAHFYSLLLL